MVSISDHAIWLKVNHIVRATLLASLLTEIMAEVHDLLPAHAIWSTLCQRFLDNTMAREIKLR